VAPNENAMAFNIQAWGDLNCNGVWSYYGRPAYWKQGLLTAAGGLSISNPLE
jgi:hypothetical protein